MDILSYGIGASTSLLGFLFCYNSLQKDVQQRDIVKNTSLYNPSYILKTIQNEHSPFKMKKSPYNDTEYIFRSVIQGYPYCKYPIISHIDGVTELSFIDYQRFNNFYSNRQSRRRLNRWTYGVDFDIIDPYDESAKCGIRAKPRFLQSFAMSKIGEKDVRKSRSTLWQKMIEALSFVRIGYTDQEFGMRVGLANCIVAFGDIIYNTQTKTLRMDKAISIADSVESIMKEMNTKISVKTIACGVLLYLTFFCARRIFWTVNNYIRDRLKIAKLSDIDYVEVDNMDCAICKNNRRKVLFLPCHHLALCVSCFSKIKNSKDVECVCPICKEKVTDHTEIYIS